MRRSLYLLVLPILLLTLSAMAWVSAQDNPAPAESAVTLPITEDVRYQVGVNETLDTIGALFDVSVACLQQTNELTNANRITVGQILVIRVACPPYEGLNYVPFPRPFEQGGGGDTYVVRAGDTLSDIALAYNVSVISLQEFNEIGNPNDIRIGQVLQIPAGVTEFGRVPPLDASILEQGGAEGDIIYVVQPGDTLDVVGAFYNANPSCIAETNNITNPQRLQPRTTILISEACAPYIGPNTAGGRIIPFDGLPTSAPTQVITATPRATLIPSPTLPPPDAPAATAQPLEVTPTPEGAAPATETPIEPTAAPPLEATPTFTPVVINEVPTMTSTPLETVLPPTVTLVPTPTAEGAAAQSSTDTTAPAEGESLMGMFRSYGKRLLPAPTQQP